MRYAIQEATFELPEGMHDQTVNIFTTTESGTSPFNIIVTRSKPKATDLGQHVDAEVETLKQAMAGYEFMWKRSYAFGGKPAVIVAAKTSASGQTMEQRQIYFLLPTGSLTFTISVADRFTDEHMATLMRFAGSFAFTPPEPA